MRRRSNIELARIVAIFMVILIHLVYNYGAFRWSKSLSAPWILSLFIAAFSISAVPAFTITTGYFLSAKNGNINNKAINIIRYTLYFLFVIFIIFFFIDRLSPFKAIISSLMHVTYPWWYIWIIIPVYFLSPYFNIIINRINNKQYKMLLTILIISFLSFPLSTIHSVSCRFFGKIILCLP